MKVCCGPLPDGASDAAREPRTCTWPQSDCYDNGPGIRTITPYRYAAPGASDDHIVRGYN